MTKDQPKKFIELRIDRDFGEIISLYFEFFKQNIKKFTNIFLSYNGIFLIGLLLVSYLLVSGVIGIITSSDNSLLSSFSNNESAYSLYFIIGGLLFFVIFIMVAVLNYSLSTAYMIKYEQQQGQDFKKGEVWDTVKNNLGKIISFILILMLLFFGFMILIIFLTFIPILGMFLQYIAQYFLMAWVGVSFFVMLKEGKGVLDALGEGYNLITQNFWKAIGVNFILGLLITILFMIILMIPSVVVGAYTFHVIQNEVALSSLVPTILYTLGTCFFLIITVYVQCLSQFVNGLLYFSLHEKTYNINTRNKIDQIGNQE
ncbi:hypothetical protein SAMN04487911_10296 [Arenibacter nanhaiticus]|uniref:Membrane domain of glycerophosphoryl diester phosphodiesterase n=1 Tax=Arenibacter nanhaiticus TaxID=558155 RepID=A0A1M6B7R5_9FLAO|nr:hypothetical protein [Arenibacter nanhaiticus]SHI44789.1 hypothetical protein SAMN04487911_10296 [Arenibacter nanhaiticus]